MTRPVLVTGATGFVGSALVGELSRRGFTVHALARRTSDRSVVGDLPVTWHEGDLRNAASVDRAVAAACAGDTPGWVLHAGAVISYRSRDAELQRDVNVEGTRNVLDACRRWSAGRLLHVSSVVAVGHAAAGEVLDESAPFNGAELHCDYTDTKRRAEELVLSSAPELDVVVVNPGAIFGSGHTGPNTVRFLQRIAHRSGGPFTPPGALSVVGRDDVVTGCLLALQRGERGRRYLLTESVFETSELFALAAREMGVAGRHRALPRPLWRAVGAVIGAVDRWVDPEQLTPQAVRMLGARFAFSSARALAELEWRPRPFGEVLGETVAWMRSAGLLD